MAGPGDDPAVPANSARRCPVVGWGHPAVELVPPAFRSWVAPFPWESLVRSRAVWTMMTTSVAAKSGWPKPVDDVASLDGVHAVDSKEALHARMCQVRRL